MGGWCRVGIGVALLAGAWASPAPAYVRSRTDRGDPLAWRSRCIPWHLNERGSDDVPFEGVWDATGRSFQAWQGVDCSAVEFLGQGITNDTRVGMVVGGPNINLVVFTEAGWSHQRDVIALTTVTFCNDDSGSECEAGGHILDADIEMNGETFTFTTSGVLNQVKYDVRNTLTHEIGHLLGLDHVPPAECDGPCKRRETCATMCASAPAGERSKSILAPDDVDGMCDTYPVPDGVVRSCEALLGAGDLVLEISGDYFVDPDDLADGGTGGGGGGDSGCVQAGGPAGILWPLLMLLWAERRR